MPLNNLNVKDLDTCLAILLFFIIHWYLFWQISRSFIVKADDQPQFSGFTTKPYI
jgi:hypothetical protein